MLTTRAESPIADLVPIMTLSQYFQKHGVANRLEQRSLLITVNAVAALSIFFFGHDHGVTGGVNTARHYASIMGFGQYDDMDGLVRVDDPLLQGGIRICGPSLDRPFNALRRMQIGCFCGIKNIVKLEQDSSQSTSYFAMFFGIKQGKLRTARRVQLVIWLQILQEWIGIAGITIYGPEIFTIAGIAAKDRQWVSGLNNITYTLATLICVFTLDRIGRRWTLYWGAVGQ
ncbi:hypothetical protein LTR49_027496, partial [Elasticomyces elasticus]